MIKIEKERLLVLRPQDVREYLLGRGWTQVKLTKSESAAIYRHPKTSETEILLPLQQDLADYALRMADVVHSLATFEERSFDEVINDLSSPPSDIIRFRIATPNTTMGTVPLYVGCHLIQGGIDILEAAACSAFKPMGYYPKESFKEVKNFMNECRLGQTERGSFIATILAPVPPKVGKPIEDNLLNDEILQAASEPFARRATIQLMSALKIIQDSLKTGEPDRILKGIEQGISANLCQAITNMKPSGDQSCLDISMNWARNRPLVIQGLPDKVSFFQDSFAVIEEAGRELRKVFTPIAETLTGIVVALHAEETTLLESFKGQITLKTEFRSEPIYVKLALSQNDYKKACDAHRDVLTVSVQGKLQHERKMYELLQPKDFQVLPESAKP